MAPGYVAAGVFIHLRPPDIGSPDYQPNQVTHECVLALITRVASSDDPDESATMYYTVFPWHGPIADACHRAQGKVSDPDWHFAATCNYTEMIGVNRDDG